MKDVYAARRKKLMETKSAPSIVILYSGSAPMRSADEQYKFSVNRNFYYYTGIDRENMILVLKKLTEGEIAEELYIEAFDEVMAKWVGPRMKSDEAAAISGIESICYLDAFDEALNTVIDRNRTTKTIQIYLDLWKYKAGQAPTEAHKLAEKLRREYPAVEIRDAYADFVAQRIVKSEEEIEKMMVAQRTTQKAVEELMQYVKPGMNECEMEGAFDFALRRQGVREHAFPSIVAGGVRATTLHYSENNQVVHDGELILIDLGSANEHYCADISRTFPVNGRFTKRQKEVYDVVLEAQRIVMEHAVPGKTLKELNQMVIDFYESRLESLGLGGDGKKVSDYYYHGVSHHLGLDTHDICCEEHRVLRPGMVITVEPGFYIAEEAIGVRIENDILITDGKAVDLSRGILKTTEEIEAWMNA